MKAWSGADGVRRIFFRRSWRPPVGSNTSPVGTFTAIELTVTLLLVSDPGDVARVEVIGDAIVLSVMRFADELVEVEQFEFPAAHGVRKQELDMAKALVNSLAADWDPAKYTDQYRENLMRIIQGKMKGKEVHLAPDVEPRQAEVVDLMERLRRSLAQSGGAGARPRAASPRQARAAKSHGAAKRAGGRKRTAA